MLQQQMSLTDRYQNRKRGKIGEKSPVNLVRLAAQNFNDLQRTSRYLFAQEASEAAFRQNSPPKQKLPKLRNIVNNRGYVSLDAAVLRSQRQRHQRSSTTEPLAHQIHFQAPGHDERLNQRISIDYDKIQKIILQREARNSSKHDKILQLLNEKQQLVDRKSSRNRDMAGASYNAKQFNQTQPTFNLIDRKQQRRVMFRSIDASQSSFLDSHDEKEVPPHFAYPETNMNLTCNYFGANDYTRKQTIEDIRMKVIEERSTKKPDPQLPRPFMIDRQESNQEQQEAEQNRAINLEPQQATNTMYNTMTEFASQKKAETAAFNRTGGLNSPAPCLASASPHQIVTSDRLKQSSEGKEKQKATSIYEKSIAARTETPDGCKGVQIDSSIDMRERDDERFKAIMIHGLSSSSATPAEADDQSRKLRLVPQLHMSTHLFNGDYLVQTVNNTPSQQASPQASRVVLPTQLIQIPSSPSKKNSKPISKQKSKQSSLTKQQASQLRKSQEPPRKQNYNHHVTYFAGPQINQINLHVHFNSASKSQFQDNLLMTTSPKAAPMVDNSPFNLLRAAAAGEAQPERNEITAWPQAQKVQSILNSASQQQNGNESRVLLSHAQIDHGSKQTLNQSSSKVLQQNAAQSRLNHAHESPLDNRNLNKYSSLQTQIMMTSQSPQTRLEQTSDQKLSEMKQAKTSGVIAAVDKDNVINQSSVLGLNLNSTDSIKSSVASLMKNKLQASTLQQPTISGKEIQTQTQQVSELDQISQVGEQFARDKANMSKFASSNGRTTVNSNFGNYNNNSKQGNTVQNKQEKQSIESQLAEMQATERDNNDLHLDREASEEQKKQTESVINHILTTLSQQKKSATIKITTHGKVSPHQQPHLDQQYHQFNKAASATKSRELQDFNAQLLQQLQQQQTGASSIDNAKLSKMKRSKKHRANTIEPKTPLSHLHIANYFARKLEDSASSSDQIKLFNTMYSGGFGQPTEGFPVGQDMRFATVTQAAFHQNQLYHLQQQQQQKSSQLQPFHNGSGYQNNDLIFGLTPLSGRIPNEMYRTIMNGGGARWNSIDLASGTQADRHSNRLNFNQTGFSMRSSLGGTTFASPEDNLRATLYKTLFQSTQQSIKPNFSLESRPEHIAAANQESSVLFRVDPKGQVGRFRPRKQRVRESFGERNSRLGHLATRTSLAKIKHGMHGFEGKKFKNDIGYALKPEMLQTNTTILSKRDMEREISNLEQTMAPPSTHPDKSDGAPPTTTRKVDELDGRGGSGGGDGGDQVIYEESVNDAHLDHDDRIAESRLSHTLSTFDSHNTNKMKLMQQNQHKQKARDPSRDKECPRDDGKVSTQKHSRISRSNSPHTSNLQRQGILNHTQSSNQKKVNMQEQVGNTSQRIAYDKIMLEQIKHISQKQQMQQMPQNKQAIVKHNVYPIQANKINLNKLKSKKLTIDGSKSNGFRNSLRETGIKENEFLEGHSIYSIMQNSTWSMIRPPVSQFSTHNSPTTSVKQVITKVQTSPLHKLNQSHIVVVQTPETPHLNKHEDLKQRLDIKIRCPSQLLLPEVISAINKKLTLTISLFYFDGTQSLTSIQSGSGPVFVMKNVHLNQQGFVLHTDRSGHHHNHQSSQQQLSKWNLYDDMFKKQLSLDDLNFMQRKFIVEIELTDPRNRDIYLLRYLTFNQMTQTEYPKIFITIMQHLTSKKRPLRMFDGLAVEVLDLAKEPSLQEGTAGLDKLFDRLVMKEISYSIVMKKKPKIECPPIRMKGIILESPKRKVQIKGLSEFISLNDGLFNRPKIAIPQNQNTTDTLPQFRESHDTLHPGNTDSQYVAVPVTNHELPTRTLQGSEMSSTGPLNHDQSVAKGSLNKLNKTVSNRNISKSPTTNAQESPLGKSQSRNLRGSPNTYRGNNKNAQMKLNYDSTSRILIDSQQHVLDPCMQVKKITEQRVLQKTPPRRIKEETKPINKQQFHIDPNLDKGIDCSFDALGSSEGRHSVNEDFTPPGSTKHRRHRRLQRFSSSVVDEQDSGESKIHANEVETIARLSRHNLNFGSNMSELEDEHNDTFGQTDRLQSIFAMNKKESDLQEKLSSGMLMIRGCSRTDVGQRLSPNRSKDLHFGKKNIELAVIKQSMQKPEFVLPKGILPRDTAASGGVKIQQQHHQLEHVEPLMRESADQEHYIELQDAALSTGFDDAIIFEQLSPQKEQKQQELLVEDGGSSSLRRHQPRMARTKEPAQKSIVNILAEELIKDPKSPQLKRVSNLSHMTKKTMPRRSNLRHALADEKSKQLLLNNQQSNPLTKSTLQIQRKQLNASVPSRTPRRSPMGMADQEQLLHPGRGDQDSVESEIHSMRRDSAGSQTNHGLNPTLAEMGPEIIIVNQKKKKRVGKPRKTETSFATNTSPMKQNSSSCAN